MVSTEVAPADAEATELDQAERELAAAERALAPRVPKAARQSKGLGARARQLLHFAEKNGLPASAPACAGLRGLSVPEVDAGLLDRAKKARRQAVDTRRQACADLEAAVAAVEAAVARLAELEHEVRAAVTAHGDDTRAAAAKARPGVDQRRDRRVRLERSVDLSSDDNFYVGFANDVSVGGLFVATWDPLPRGTVVELVFTLPDGTHVEAEGEVRWTREYDERAPTTFPGAGIQFKRIDPESLKAIARFVEERDAMFYDD